MKNSPIAKIIARYVALSMVSLMTVLGLSGCGGSGGSGSNEVVIAPETLDGVQIAFFGAFTAQFSRGRGTEGKESGAYQYTALRDSFRYSVQNGNADLGFTIFLPVILKNTRYQYERTGLDTGRITLTFFNNQVYPIDDADEDNPNGTPAVGDMFWGGPEFTARNLVIDVLFTDQGGFIGSVSTRIRSYFLFRSQFTDAGVVNSVLERDFDTTDVGFVLTTGGRVPSGYNPTIDPETPSSIVWASLQGRSINFLGSDGVLRTIAHQSVGGVGPDISGEDRIEESGTILVDCVSENVEGAGGTYSYTRTGGVIAKFAVRYERTVNKKQVEVNLTYEMRFRSLEDGRYTDSKGVKGEFDEILENPN